MASLFISLLAAAGDYGFEPNYVVLARRGWNSLKAEGKDTDNDTIFEGRGRMVDGVPVVFTTALDPTKKQIIGGVFNARTIQMRVRANPTIQVGMNADDMIRGLRTIMVEMEVALATRGPQLLLPCTRTPPAAARPTGSKPEHIEADRGPGRQCWPGPLSL